MPNTIVKKYIILLQFKLLKFIFLSMSSTIVNYTILLQFKLLKLFFLNAQYYCKSYYIVTIQTLKIYFLSMPSSIVNNIMSTLVIIIHLTYSYFRNQQRLFDDVLISSPEMLHQRITSVHQNRSQQKILVQPSVPKVIYDYITRRCPSPYQVDNR